MTQELYIGSPSGIVLCINKKSQKTIEGEFYCRYVKEPVPFQSITQLVAELERFMDDISYPFPGNNRRHFSKVTDKSTHHEEKHRIMKDEELLAKRGKLGTFIIQIQQRQNSTWQGKVTWVESKESQYFRSALELLEMIDEAVAPIEEGQDIE